MRLGCGAKPHILNPKEIWLSVSRGNNGSPSEHNHHPIECQEKQRRCFQQWAVDPRRPILRQATLDSKRHTYIL
jgi:hypothetical protein